MKTKKQTTPFSSDFLQEALDLVVKTAITGIP